jgi:hypothetical protein
MRKAILRRLFRTGLVLNAALTRSRRLRFLEAQVLTPFFVRFTRLIRGDRTVEQTPEALGREWERLLGDPRYAHVTEVDHATATAYGEITGSCPLRASGDLAACHRLMAYDRRLLAPHGARLVVLASQAEPGRRSCRIAIRHQQLPAADLVPAWPARP